MLGQEVVDALSTKLGYSGTLNNSIIMLLLNVNNFVIMFLLAYEDYGGPVGGVQGAIAAEACDAVIEECRTRGCIEEVSMILVVLGAPADPYRRGSPTAEISQAFTASANGPPTNNSTGSRSGTPRGAEVIPGSARSADNNASSIPPIAATQQQRRNSRATTPSNTATNGLTNVAEIRTNSRRNTPGAVTMQAYLDAAKLGGFSVILEDDLASVPALQLSAIIESSEVHTAVGVGLGVGINMTALSAGEAVSSSAHSSSQDDADYAALHANRRGGSPTLSTELYKYNSSNTLMPPLSPLRQPTLNVHGVLSTASSVGVCTPSEPKRRQNSDIHRLSATSPSSLCITSPTGAGVEVPISIATTPVSSLKSIFAMVSDDAESNATDSSPFNVATAREAVRKQLGFNDEL